jgi:hypothetical protein
MQKGYKRSNKGMAVLRFFICLITILLLVFAGYFCLTKLDYSDKLANPDAEMRAYVEMTRIFLARPELQQVQQDVMLQIAAMHDQAADDLLRLPREERRRALATPEGRCCAMLGNHGLRYHMGRKEKLRRIVRAVRMILF